MHGVAQNTTRHQSEYSQEVCSVDGSPFRDQMLAQQGAVSTANQRGKKRFTECSRPVQDSKITRIVESELPPPER